MIALRVNVLQSVFSFLLQQGTPVERLWVSTVANVCDTPVRATWTRKKKDYSFGFRKINRKTRLEYSFILRSELTTLTMNPLLIYLFKL